MQYNTSILILVAFERWFDISSKFHNSFQIKVPPLDQRKKLETLHFDWFKIMVLSAWQTLPIFESSSCGFSTCVSHHDMCIVYRVTICVLCIASRHQTLQDLNSVVCICWTLVGLLYAAWLSQTSLRGNANRLILISILV